MKTSFTAQVVSWMLSLTYVSVATSLSLAQQIPKVEEDNLAGHKVVLPDAALGNVAVLVLGFTRGSKNPTRAWAEKIGSDLGKTAGFELYSLPVLEEVPRMIRGMVIAGMKHDIPEGARSNFVPVLHNESEWKRLVNYKEPDDAYLMVLDRSGKIAYQMHGSLNDQAYNQLRQQVEPLLR